MHLNIGFLSEMGQWRDPVDTERKLNAHKTFRRRPGHLLNVLRTFSLRHVYTGVTHEYKTKILSNSNLALNSLSTNPTKWSNTLKQMNYLRVFDHFVGLALKRSTRHVFRSMSNIYDEEYRRKSLKVKSR